MRDRFKAELKLHQFEIPADQHCFGRVVLIKLFRATIRKLNFPMAPADSYANSIYSWVSSHFRS